MTKGSIELRGERIENLTPADLVKRGVIQVMEAPLLAHLTIEENLLTGAYAPRDRPKAAVAQPGEGLHLFPAPEDAPHRRRPTPRAASSRCAPSARADGQPDMVLLDEPSMGLAPQIVEEVFEIVKDLNTKEKVTFLLAEQNTNMALRYADHGYILENGRIVMDGAAKDLREQRDVKSSTSAWAAATARASRTSRATSGASAGWPERRWQTTISAPRSRSSRKRGASAAARPGPRRPTASSKRRRGHRESRSMRAAFEGLGGEAPAATAPSGPADPEQQRRCCATGPPS